MVGYSKQRDFANNGWREPGAHALFATINAVAAKIANGNGCFVVLTENKIRVKRPTLSDRP